MTDSVADTWEDLEDSGELDIKLNKLVLTTAHEKETIKSDIRVVNTLPWLPDESSGSTVYQPAVRILKRDPTAAAMQSANQVVQTKPIRSLQEREAAYAEARLRILGSAPSAEEEDQDKELSDLESSLVRSTRSTTTDACDTSNGKDSCPILRQPRGPDGTTGFASQH